MYIVYSYQVEVVIPTVEVICNYCKNILITAKMEKEVAIICLVYLERFLIKGGYLNSKNWRKITFTALVLNYFVNYYRLSVQKYGMMNHLKTTTLLKPSLSSLQVR